MTAARKEKEMKTRTRARTRAKTPAKKDKIAASAECYCRVCRKTVTKYEWVKTIQDKLEYENNMKGAVIVCNACALRQEAAETRRKKEEEERERKKLDRGKYTIYYKCKENDDGTYTMYLSKIVDYVGNNIDIKKKVNTLPFHKFDIGQDENGMWFFRGVKTLDGVNAKLAQIEANLPKPKEDV